MQVIVNEASRAVREVGRGWKPAVRNVEGEPLTDGTAVIRSPARSWKVDLILIHLNSVIRS